MMRCVRFATQLRFQIEDETQEALVRNAERIKIISQERIIDELNKIMLSPRPSIGFVELSRAGLLPIIFPELAALEGVEVRNGRGHKDNFYHTLEVLDNVAKQQIQQTHPQPLPCREGSGHNLTAEGEVVSSSHFSLSGDSPPYKGGAGGESDGGEASLAPLGSPAARHRQTTFEALGTTGRMDV